MSKSSSVVDPWKMIEKYGADCVIYMYTVNQPGDPSASTKDLEESSANAS
jgi:valyl-tRNA synthetase